MQFIHAREFLNDGDLVEVDCDTELNIMLTTDSEFARFKNGDGCTYHGGFYKRFPVQICPKHSGYWNITLDVGVGYEANIRYSITVIKAK